MAVYRWSLGGLALAVMLLADIPAVRAEWRTVEVCRTGSSSVPDPEKQGENDYIVVSTTVCWQEADWEFDPGFLLDGIGHDGWPLQVLTDDFDVDVNDKLDCWKDVTESPAVSSPYGYSSWRDENWHFGTDITSGEANYGHGARVRSIATGVVGFVGTSDGNGNYVRVDHDDGNSSHYYHLATTDVQLGAPVVPGATIGTMNCTGYCFGSGIRNSLQGTHLHLEVRTSPTAMRDPVSRSTTVDPIAYLGGACE